MIAYLINALTLSRILISIIIFILFTTNENYFLILILFIFAGFSDFLDGYLARTYDSSSQFGEILDPIADKILIIFLLIALSINLSSYLVGFLTSIIISREVWVSALRDYNSRNNNSTATKVIYIAKVKTSIQLLTIFIYILGLSFNAMLLIVIGDLFLIASVLITSYTGYIYTINTFNNPN